MQVNGHTIETSYHSSDNNHFLFIDGKLIYNSEDERDFKLFMAQMILNTKVKNNESKEDK
jgi:hypothetical protein